MSNNFYNAAKLSGERGKMDKGQGTVGRAYRFGRDNPGEPRPKWTGPPSSFASQAWKAGRDAALTTKCESCGAPTKMLATKRCDKCWELERRITADPELAQKILERRKS